ncbi:hypothetical protein KY285_011222 [Solanum tuberosum]|nr:hypothetical protein KY284_034313 [Solanum tuberosum]KAH0649106.1 hypothetical protein KY285_034354 [Solanum tuberosum]KAH0726001.1 hypothetical protein KY284_001866 [Solanum tuberosum]KAH0735515.1 hypothetical protein KY285_011222 [Solanum tuberosum]
MTAVVGGELSGQNAFVNVEASSGTSGHPISRIGTPTSDVGIAPTAQTEKSGYEVSGETPAQLPPFSPSSYFGDGIWSSLHTRR